MTKEENRNKGRAMNKAGEHGVDALDYLKQVEGLDINQVEDGFILYDPEKDMVHFLNHTALFVLELCNGRHRAGEILEIVKGTFELKETPDREIRDILDRFIHQGLVIPC